MYEPQEVEKLSHCYFNLAFQFPLMFWTGDLVVDMPRGNRYARSIFLQGLLATANGKRPNIILELLNLQEEYHNKLAEINLDPVRLAVSFVTKSNSVDYFLIGVDSEIQLKEILTQNYIIKKHK